jgi:hypothetical protein
LPGAVELIARFASFKRGLAVVQRVTGNAEAEAARRRRTDDLLVSLMPACLRQRPPLAQLPRTLQHAEPHGLLDDSATIGARWLARAPAHRRLRLARPSPGAAALGRMVQELTKLKGR